MIWIFMESEGDEIKSKQASKRDRTLPLLCMYASMPSEMKMRYAVYIVGILWSLYPVVWNWFYIPLFKSTFCKIMYLLKELMVDSEHIVWIGSFAGLENEDWLVYLGIYFIWHWL